MQFTYCPVCGTELVAQERFGEVRQCCPRSECGYIFFLDPKVVAVVLVEQAGQILLGRRNHDPGKGLWSFPSGYVNRGEVVEEAARREVKEETNLDVKVLGLLGVYSESDTPNVLIVYRASIGAASAELKPQAEEVQELGFFDLDALPQLAFSFDRRILGDWAAARARDESKLSVRVGEE